MPSEALKEEEEDEGHQPTYTCPFCVSIFHNKTTITRHIARGSAPSHPIIGSDVKPFKGRHTTVQFITIQDDDDAPNVLKPVKQERQHVDFTDDECKIVEVETPTETPETEFLFFFMKQQLSALHLRTVTRINQN